MKTKEEKQFYTPSNLPKPWIGYCAANRGYGYLKSSNGFALAHVGDSPGPTRYEIILEDRDLGECRKAFFEQL